MRKEEEEELERAGKEDEDEDSWEVENIGEKIWLTIDNKKLRL